MTDIAVQEAPALESTVARAATGDQAAFSSLVVQHHASMARVAFVVCGDPEIARDAVQSAWTIAWRRLHTLRDVDQVRPWLVAIAANEARQAVRRGRRRVVIDLSTVEDHDIGGDPADTIALLDLQRVMRGLRPDERSLLALRYVAGLDSTEIARYTGMSASGVRSRLSRLIERLRTDLDHD